MVSPSACFSCVLEHAQFVLQVIHFVLQCCKLIKCPVGLGLDDLQLVRNSVQQESCGWENLSTQVLPPMPCNFLTWVSRQDSVENVEGGISPSAVCTLNSSYLCNHAVKISFADTLWLSCVAVERSWQWIVVAPRSTSASKSMNTSYFSACTPSYTDISQFTFGIAFWQAHQSQCRQEEELFQHHLADWRVNTVAAI